MTSTAAHPHIRFVTGKGGVGKSTVALAYALKYAEEGHRTLLIEMAYKSYYSDFLGIPELGYEPRNLKPRLDLACWSGERCLREYVLHYLKLERVYRLFFENRVMKALLDVAPGLKEISLLGKITSGIRHIGPSFAYDRVVVDCFATGHALAFFQAPQGLAEAIHMGPMGEQSRSIDRVLKDPRFCSYTIVSLLEDLPVTETEELARSLHSILGVTPEVLANKVLVSPLNREQLAGIQDPDVQDFVRYLSDTLERQKGFLERLKSGGSLKGKLPFYLGQEPWGLVTHLKEALP